VAALYFDKLAIHDPVSASWATIGADHHALEFAKQLQDADLLHTVTPADVLAKYAAPITDTIRQDMRDRQSLNLCEAPRGERSLTLSPAKVPQDM
jgi:hypothetical protein